MHGLHFLRKLITNVKKLDCALLPPTRRTLEMKIRRAHYVTMLWTNATTATPLIGLEPYDYGWTSDVEGRLQPSWFNGPAMPDILYKNTDNEEEASSGDEDSDEEVSET